MARQNRYNPNTGGKTLPPSRRPERAGARPADVVNRDAMAEAVHRACCEVRGGDGLGGCHMYAAAGYYLLNTRARGEEFSVQAGTFCIQPDPDDPDVWFTLLAENGGWDRGEIHCWIASSGGVLVDFSARHFHAMCERFINVGGDLPPWNRPEPPPYLWGRLEELPRWVRYRADLASSIAANQGMRGGLELPGGSGELFRATERHYRNLVG